MNWIDYVGYIVNALIVALFGAVITLIRKVFTNEKEIAILNQQLIALKEQLKTVDRIEEELVDLRSDIKDILFKLTER